MTDRCSWDGWDAWDAWDSRESWADPRASRDDFRGYDLWKNDVGPWPSVGDDPGPTAPHPRRSFWEETVIDLTAEQVAPIPEPEPDPVVDLVDEVVDLVDDIDDRTR
jgi:hypothetical protein